MNVSKIILCWIEIEWALDNWHTDDRAKYSLPIPECAFPIAYYCFCFVQRFIFRGNWDEFWTMEWRAFGGWMMNSGKAICGGGNCANGNFEWMDSANSGWICPMLIHRGMGQINFASILTLPSRTPIILFLDYVKNNLIVEETPEGEMTKTVDDGHKWAI